MKRTIALILALAFAFSLLPVSALAADGDLSLTVINLTTATQTEVIASGASPTLAEADTPAEGMEFWKWVRVSGDLAALTGFDAKAADNNGATSALRDTDPEQELTIKAVYRKTAGNGIEFPGSGVAVAVNGKDNFDSNSPKTAKADDLIRVRVGENTDSFRIKGVRVKGTTSGSSVNIDADLITEESGTDSDGQGYRVYKFTMPDEPVKVTVYGEYLLTVSGAKIDPSSSGTAYQDAEGNDSDTKRWVEPGTATLVITPTTGMTVKDWTSGPAVEFTYADDARVEAEFTMPSSKLEITVNYKADYTVTVIDRLVSPESSDDVTATAADKQKANEGDIVTIEKPDDDKPFTLADGSTIDGTFQECVVDPATATYIIDETTGEMKLTMPAGNVTVIRKYTQSYDLTVVDADPAGTQTNVAVGSDVTVTATVNSADQIFDYWQYAPASSTPPNVEETNTTAIGESSTTEFKMPIADPDKGLTVTAHYKYKVELTQDGSGALGTINGTGKATGYFAPGETVRVTAGAASSATKAFKAWEIVNPAGLQVSYEDGNTATFTMPKEPVTLNATYADAFTVKGATGATFKLRNQTTAGKTEIVATEGTLLTAIAPQTNGGKAFSEWRLYDYTQTDFSDGNEIAGGYTILGATEDDFKKSTFNFTMPGENYQLRPVYAGTAYRLSVTGGTGAGSYAAGTTVTITANAVAGKKFSHWEVVKTGSVTQEITEESYTFEMPAATMSAKAVYVQLYSLTISNTSDYMATADAAGKLSMTRPEDATATPPVSELTYANAAGETSVSAYWQDGEVITIKTPASIPLADGSNAVFTGWVLVSGSGTLGSVTSATTTFTMTTKNASLIARYGGNMLLYKNAERVQVDKKPLDTYRYDDWSYADVAAGAIVSIEAADPDGTFVRWACEPSDLIGDKTAKQISFNMPNGTAKVWPEYAHTLTLTNAEYSIDGGTTWTRGGGEQAPASIATGTTVMIRPVEDLVGSDGTGKSIFKSWKYNTTLLSRQTTTKNASFVMPSEDVIIETVYQTYTLTVRRYVDSTETESFNLRPGETMTFEPQNATGGRQFGGWSATGGLTFTQGADVVDPADKDRVISQNVTVTMGTANATLTAQYTLYPRYDYWSTGAFIRMTSEPKRYYSVLEYFSTDTLEVMYYEGAQATGKVVSTTDLTCQVVYPGTTTLATDANGCFIGIGQFELLITFRVAGRQMAPTIRVMNTASTYITCYNIRPEYVRNFNKLYTDVYYEGENVNKDGLDVWLVSADHVTGNPQYFSVRELAESEYGLYPRNQIAFNGSGDAVGLVSNASTRLPTVAEIQAILDAGGSAATGFRYVDGKYYVQMWIYAVDEAQVDANGKPVIMQYMINNASDAIWVQVCTPVSNISLTPVTGSNTGDIVANLPQAVYPHVSWEITQGSSLGDRYLEIKADGYTNPADLAAALDIVNSDPNVAYLETTSNPLRYKVVVKAPGVTTITVRSRGDASTATKATCEITVHSGTEAVPMTSFGGADHSAGLNKTAVNLFVGNKLTLYPTQYTPSNADTTCNYYPVFTDGLTPQNAEYYVSVSAAGVVEVLKFTDRQVRVYAVPVYAPVGQGKANDYNDDDTIWSYCDINVMQIPVDNMTMYPATLTMYRLGSYQMKVTLYPEAASDQTILWSSSDSNIVSVKDGVLTANMLGTATITAKSQSNENVYQTCKVTVLQSVLLSGLMLNRTSATLGIDDTMVLTPYYTPSTATMKTVAWTSSDPAVATVDSNGKVRGISEGAALITATSNDGSGKKATCVVSVSTIVASAIVLNKQTLAMTEDDTVTLTATVYPTNVSTNKVVWSSSNEKVVTVDPDGVVTAVGGGNAIITATARDASTKYADCVVVVTAKIPATSMTLNYKSFDLLLNDTTLLTATLAPSNATSKVTYTSSNPTVLSVDEKGKLSGLTTGTATVTVKAGDLSTAITVNVVTKMYTVGKVVNCSRRVNVRTSDSGTSGVVGYAYLGSEYRVLDKSGNWYKIQYNATTVAYIWHRYLSAGETTAGYVSAGKVGATTTTDPSATATPVVPAAKTITIVNCTTSVNVRSGAGTTFSKLGYAYRDEVFTYTGVANGWYTIEYKGVTGYVSSQFVQVNG